MNAHSPQLDLALLLPPDLAAAIDDADRILRDRIRLAEEFEPPPPPRPAPAPVVVPLGRSDRRVPRPSAARTAPASEAPPLPTSFHHDVRAAATLVRIRKTVADFLLRHPELLPPDGSTPSSTSSSPSAPSTPSALSTRSISSSSERPSSLDSPSAASSRSPWRVNPPPPRSRNRPPRRSTPYRPRRGETPMPDPTMAGIIAGRLDVRDDGAVVPFVEPGARAPIADPNVMLSPHLADEVAHLTRDLRDAIPNHRLSHSLIERPARFARDVQCLSRLVALHATLAEIELRRRRLTHGLEASPLAKATPYHALALQLPSPPARCLDELFEWMESADPLEEPLAAGGPPAPSTPQSSGPGPAHFAPPFDLALGIERIDIAAARLADFDPGRHRRFTPGALDSLYPRLLSHPGPVSPPDRDPSRLGRQPSLAVMSCVSLFPVSLRRALGFFGLERFIPEPPAPRAAARRLHAFLAESAFEWLTPRSHAPRSGSASGAAFDHDSLDPQSHDLGFGSAWGDAFAHAPP